MFIYSMQIELIVTSFTQILSAHCYLNAHERILGGLRLPHAVCFTKMVLDIHTIIRLHLRDASNFYYLLRIPIARRKFQAIGPPVELDEGNEVAVKAVPRAEPSKVDDQPSPVG